MAIRMIKKKFAANSSKDIRDFDREQKQVCIHYLLDKGLSASDFVGDWK